MSQNSDNTASGGTTPKETKQPSSRDAAPSTSNTETGSANIINQPRHHIRRNSQSDLILIEVFDMTLEEDQPVMVPHQEDVLDEDEGEWIKKDLSKDDEEADNAQGPRV